MLGYQNVKWALMERYKCVMETDKTNETLHRWYVGLP